MERRGKVLVAGVGLAVAVAGSALVGVAIGGGSAGGGEGSGFCEADAATGQETEIASAKLIIEYNATDEDIGVHGGFDDHGWKRLCVFDPNGRLVLDVGPRGQLHDLSMAGIFFESREPPRSEFSYADLRAAFPEGEYTVRGESFDGKTLVGAATFTHDVPAPPEITFPGLAEEPEGTGPGGVPLEDLVIRWDPVTETTDGGSVEITGYEVIITKEAEDDPNGFSRPTYDVHVLPTVDHLTVPAEFLEADTVYELEVLALEASGNQTISVGFFKTA